MTEALTDEQIRANFDARQRELAKIPKDEYLRRFIDHMVNECGEDIRADAADMALSHWETRKDDFYETPETDADTEMSYFED
jgi:hypothetical protein